MLLLLFLSFQGGRSLCYHTHIFGNKIVSHSHPFNNPDRQHSADELVSLAQIAASSLTDEISSDYDAAPAVFVIDVFGDVTVSRLDLGYRQPSSGRAPPAAFHTSLI